MLIAIVSDTHGQITYTRRAVEVLREHELAAVIHCGDVGSAGVVDLFAEWPTHFVLGNVDDDDRDWEVVVRAAGQWFHGRFGELELAERRIAFLHGDDSHRLRTAIAGGQFDLLCHGHTHVRRLEQVGKTLVLNPGAIHRADPHTLAIVDLTTLATTFHEC